MKQFEQINPQNNPITTVLFKTDDDQTTFTSSNGVKYSLPFVNYRTYKAESQQQLINLVVDLVQVWGEITHITIHTELLQDIYGEYCDIRNLFTDGGLNLENELHWVQLEDKRLADFKTWVYIISKYQLEQEGENKNPDVITDLSNDIVGFEQNTNVESEMLADSIDALKDVLGVNPTITEVKGHKIAIYDINNPSLSEGEYNL